MDTRTKLRTPNGNYLAGKLNEYINAGTEEDAGNSLKEILRHCIDPGVLKTTRPAETVGRKPYLLKAFEADYDIEKYANEARTAINEGDVTKAIGLYDKIIEKCEGLGWFEIAGKYAREAGAAIDGNGYDELAAVYGALAEIMDEIPVPVDEILIRN